MNKTNLKDHREIGRDLDLFSFHEYAPGAVFWHHKGWIIYRILEEFIRENDQQGDYQEISTPVMVKNQLFKESGHWEHFGEHNMFNLAIYEEEEEKRFLENSKLAEKEGRIKVYKIDGTPMIFPQANYSLKPMNCPEAALVFRSKTRSYQDLPIRLSEFGILHRRELSGVLGGLLRVRQFVIDDAHLFVRPDQIQGEIHKLLLLVIEVYQSLGFKPKFYLATRPDKAMGDVKTWKLAEEDLESALKKAKVNFNLKPKDGAFYGPKIDFHLKDSLNRTWQCSTIQLDMALPQRFELEYTDEKGEIKRPIMLHRVIYGAIERFLGILTEHLNGKFPLWLSPNQIKIMTMNDEVKEYAKEIYNKLFEQGFMVELDDRNESIGKKAREAQIQRFNYLVTIGEKEQEKNVIAIKKRDDEKIIQLTLEDFISQIKKEIEKKG